MTPPTAPTTGTPANTTAGSRQVPSYGGNTLRGRIFMTNQRPPARHRHPPPDNTVTVDHLPQAPLRRLRFTVAHRPLLRAFPLVAARCQRAHGRIPPPRAGKCR